MLKGVRQGKEIKINVANKIGILSDMSKVIADYGINIEALAGYAMDDKTAEIILITDDNLRASEALKKSNYKSIKEADVVIVDLENKPGALKHITSALAAKDIDINYIYGTSCAEGCPSRVVLSTSDNQKALLVLKK